MKRVVLIIIIVILAAMTCVFTFERIFLARPGYPDFTRFPDESALQTYLEHELPLVETTEEEVWKFLNKEGMHRCDDIVSTNEVFCVVLAPPNAGETLLNRIFTTYTYSIQFKFIGESLAAIKVRRNNLIDDQTKFEGAEDSGLKPTVPPIRIDVVIY